jgi:hypothetical protein
VAGKNAILGPRGVGTRKICPPPTTPFEMQSVWKGLMGVLIEFYVPRKHEPKKKYIFEAKRGKLLEFPDPVKQTFAERFHGILVTDKRRFSDDKV